MSRPTWHMQSRDMIEKKSDGMGHRAESPKDTGDEESQERVDGAVADKGDRDGLARVQGLQDLYSTVT